MYFAPHFTLNRVPIQAPAMLPQARIKPVRQSTKSYQELMGHSDLTTTQIYLDSFDEEQINTAMQHLV